MKTAEQIIKETYENNPKFKAQVEAHDITLQDVGVVFLPGNERMAFGTDGKALTLGYNIEAQKVVSCFTDFTHPKVSAA